MSEFQVVPRQEESTSQLIKKLEERVFQLAELENLIRHLQEKADRMRQEIEMDFDNLFEILPGYEQNIFEQALEKEKIPEGDEEEIPEYDDIPF